MHTVSLNQLPAPAITRQRPLAADLRQRPAPGATPPEAETAIVYCEGNFGAVDGKTANGLVRQSDRYRILAIIDSEKAGLDAGRVLDDQPNGIPICRDLADALKVCSGSVDQLIFGMAPATGLLSTDERGVLMEAMAHGLNIVNGLHEFLSEDPMFVAASIANSVSIQDVRKPRQKRDLRMYSGALQDNPCRRIAILGTDCAIGKRTTATILTRALGAIGLKAVMIATGQTGLIQGSRHGIALDAIPSQFCIGELEATILDAIASEAPDIVIVEGQGALSHPAYSSSAFVLRGASPHGVILQHSPARAHRCDFQALPMPTPASEIHLIETFVDTRVIGLSINHENMTSAALDAAIGHYEQALGLPVTDALLRPAARLSDMVLRAFPELRERLRPAA